MFGKKPRIGWRETSTCFANDRYGIDKMNTWIASLTGLKMMITISLGGYEKSSSRDWNGTGWTAKWSIT